MKTPKEISREMLKGWGGVVPAVAIEEAIQVYGDERAREERDKTTRLVNKDSYLNGAREMRERCAGRLVVLARAALGDGRPQQEVDSLMELSRIIRALPLEVNDE